MFHSLYIKKLQNTVHHKSNPSRRLVPDPTRPLAHPNGSGHRLLDQVAIRWTIRWRSDGDHKEVIRWRSGP